MKDSVKFSAIKKNSEIAEIFHTGNSLFNNCFTINYVRLSNEYKFAISVNKKVFRTAVERNKIKRQIRTFIKQVKNMKPIQFLVIVKKQYLKNTYNRNNLLFHDLLKKAV